MYGCCLLEFRTQTCRADPVGFLRVYPDFLGLAGNVADLLYPFNIQVQFDLYQAASYPCA